MIHNFTTQNKLTDCGSFDGQINVVSWVFAWAWLFLQKLETGSEN